MFTEGGWAERLESCKRILHGESAPPGQAPGTSVLGYLFKSEDGKYIALVYYTKRPNGEITEPVPHRLYVEGTWYYV